MQFSNILHNMLSHIKTRHVSYNKKYCNYWSFLLKLYIKTSNIAELIVEILLYLLLFSALRRVRYLFALSLLLARSVSHYTSFTVKKYMFSSLVTRLNSKWLSFSIVKKKRCYIIMVLFFLYDTFNVLLKKIQKLCDIMWWQRTKSIVFLIYSTNFFFFTYTTNWFYSVEIHILWFFCTFSIT